MHFLITILEIWNFDIIGDKYRLCTQGILTNKVNILGDHSISNGEHKSSYEHVVYTEWLSRYPLVECKS